VNTSESPGSSDSGKFYTSEKDMKGRGFGSGLSQISTFDRSPTSRREPSTESVTVNSALSPLQLLLLEDSGKKTVTTNSFSQLLSLVERIDDG
jgi:hypothetical protein